MSLKKRKFTFPVSDLETVVKEITASFDSMRHELNDYEGSPCDDDYGVEYGAPWLVEAKDGRKYILFCEMADSSSSSFRSARFGSLNVCGDFVSVKLRHPVLKKTSFYTPTEVPASYRINRLFEGIESKYSVSDSPDL